MSTRRKSYKSGEDTRERLLDAAEALFADNGFEGTSVREIANQVETQLGAISYHFGSKEQLFEQVIRRRAKHVGDLRLAALQTAKDEGSLAGLVSGYTWPFIERSSRGGDGWKNYARLIASVANSPKWTYLVTQNYDEVAALYLEEFKKHLPNATDTEIINGFDFMVGTMLAVCAETGRMEVLAKHRHRDLEETFTIMQLFLVAGFQSLQHRQ